MDNLEVKFYDTVNDELLKFAVIISQSNGKWVFCKHKERDTYEVPGGHREAGENILETAKRELQEETGAVEFEVKPICVYSVTGKTRVNDTGEETFGLLCFAEITEFAKELHSEMDKVVLMDKLPENWTYPLIQPKLIEKYLQVKLQPLFGEKMIQMKLGQYVADLRIIRLIPTLAESNAIKHGTLTDTEKNMYRAIFIAGRQL